MERFGEIVLGALMITIFLFPIIIALVLAGFAAKLFSALFIPITKPLHECIEGVSNRVNRSLESIRFFSDSKGIFGSTKNILFICFVIVFLIVHYLSMGPVDNYVENIFLLFPGTAIEQIFTSGINIGALDVDAFFVNPENYLQTIIYSFITGLFMHIGCSTTGPNKISFFVKLLYALLISLFSSIVLGMIPSDMFIISFPEVSLDFTPGTVTGDSGIAMMLAELQEMGGILLDNLVRVIPTIVAFYFLSHSIRGFAAAFLGGFAAMGSVGLVWPEGISDPNAPYAVFLFLFILVLGEVITFELSEMLNIVMDEWLLENEELFSYYNVITLLISYFFYPAFALSVLCFIALLINGFEIAVFLLGISGLVVFSLVSFAGYKINQLTLGFGNSISGSMYAAAMVFNIPIWIIYIVMFVI